MGRSKKSNLKEGFSNPAYKARYKLATADIAVVASVEEKQEATDGAAGVAATAEGENTTANNIKVVGVEGGDTIAGNIQAVEVEGDGLKAEKGSPFTEFSAAPDGGDVALAIMPEKSPNSLETGKGSLIMILEDAQVGGSVLGEIPLGKVPFFLQIHEEELQRCCSPEGFQGAAKKLRL